MDNYFTCPHCGASITEKMLFCDYCGCQVRLSSYIAKSPIQNIYSNSVTTSCRKAVNKWVSFCLCLTLGYFGAHKFYEGKPDMGVIYVFTFGFFGLGWIFDLFYILSKPNPYYV